MIGEKRKKPGRPFGKNNRKKMSITLPMKRVHWLRNHGLSQSKIIERALDAWQKETWKPIETAPRDGTTVILWHKIHKCQVACRWQKSTGWRFRETESGEKCQWIEKTLTTSWPNSAFTHWKEDTDHPKNQGIIPWERA